MTKTIVTQAQLARYQTLADGGLRLIFDGSEPSEELGGLVALANRKSGVLVFKADKEVLSADEKKVIEEFQVTGMAKVDQKSKSQQLRFSLYHYWKKLKDMGDTSEEFETFYARTMDKIIGYYEKESK